MTLSSNMTDYSFILQHSTNYLSKYLPYASAFSLVANDY